MPPCAIEFGSRFSAAARALPEVQRRELEITLRKLAVIFGQPHLHSGLGIRRLKRDYFECRMGRDVRVVFRLHGSVLKMALMGGHDDVQRFLRTL
jgi:hypothetical protein